MTNFKLFIKNSILKIILLIRKCLLFIGSKLRKLENFIEMKNLKHAENFEIAKGSVKYIVEKNEHAVTFINDKGITGDIFINTLWNSLKQVDTWLIEGDKIMMVAVENVETGKKFYIQNNYAVTSKTTELDYFNYAKKSYNTLWSDKFQIDYEVEITDYKRVFVTWVIITEEDKKNIEINVNSKLKNKNVKNFNAPLGGKRHYSTKISTINKSLELTLEERLLEEKRKKDRWLIKPLKKSGKNNLTTICTLDVETIKSSSNSNKQIPIAITFAYENKIKYSRTFNQKSFIVMIDHELLKENELKAVQQLWLKFFFKLKSMNIGTDLTIYTHNLGAFDGYFILDNLFNFCNGKDLKYENIKSIIDDQNKFILIKFDFFKQNYLYMDEEQMLELGLTDEDRTKPTLYKWTFKDSFRLFPISLNNLCKTFNVNGKISDYNNNWNQITLFENSEMLEKFKEYALNDSECLLRALNNARKMFLENYHTDITKTVSAPSLALLIYRHKYQNFDIPILKRIIDNLTRPSYFGGSSDYYKHSGENLRYYDVNSLYPNAMLNYMPLQYIKTVDGSEIDLNDENCFGFLEVIVTCPDNIKICLLPRKLKGKTLHTKGTWRGVYFSEELKAVVSYGYKIEIVKAHLFTKEIIFKQFVEDFYELKRIATEHNDPSMRYIAKLLLNSLYGLFGRKLDKIKTVVATPENRKELLTMHTVKNIIQIKENVELFLLHENLDYDLINKLNIEMSLKLFNSMNDVVKTNVAIASAVTSYARIHMMKFKTLPGINVYYTDTDSIFIDSDLPAEMIGESLGLMKDELKGGIIKKALFFGIKQYAYINDKDEVTTVFAGVPRNSLTWEAIEELQKNKKIVKSIPNQFTKSIQTLQIFIKTDKKVEIKFSPEKKLMNNEFIAIKHNDISKLEKYSQAFYNKIKKLYFRIKKTK